MDITALANVQNQSSLQQLVSISVLKMGMGMMANQGNSITEMAQELSVNPHLGANIDIKV
jgi:hypothetical protein